MDGGQSESQSRGPGRSSDPRLKTGKAGRTHPPAHAILGDDFMSISPEDLAKWIVLAIKDCENFSTKDIDPEAQETKETILEIVWKLKGRVF